MNNDAGALHTDRYIFENVPADQSETGYSMPGDLLWSRNFHPPQVVFGDIDPAGLPGMEPPGQTVQWSELIDPRTGESMDLAFVITPEPASFSMLALGALALAAFGLVRARRRGA